MAKNFRTPLKNVRHLGSAKEGANHFIVQRLTGLSNAVLAVFLVWLVASIAGADHKAAKAMFANPFVAMGLLLLILSGAVHMRLGMQTIIEDYVHNEGPKLAALAFNTFFAILVALACVFSVLKLSFGA
ncbi:MAG: succinate dehydrogenase, hydrophobic membrane anchor protein [Hyphomicrobiaceae bacterium]|nr:succinate dehydrogenase, hydrophobic membrane anchor protein [Hyphomicrobiaceae bacterium]